MNACKAARHKRARNLITNTEQRKAAKQERRLWRLAFLSLLSVQGKSDKVPARLQPERRALSRSFHTERERRTLLRVLHTEHERERRTLPRVLHTKHEREQRTLSRVLYTEHEREVGERVVCHDASPLGTRQVKLQHRARTLGR